MQSAIATRPAIFKWRKTESALILCAVRWYLRYSLSLREVEELLEERGVEADHTTVWRWVQRYSPKLERRRTCHRSAARPSPIKKEGILRRRCRHRPGQYLNNILEQNHRAIKRRVSAKQGFRDFQAARRIVQGYEAMDILRKGQVRWVRCRTDVRRHIQFINKLLELAA